MLQLYELCRLCAQKKRQKLDLFTGLTDEETKILLAKISLCLSVNVTKEDLLPKMICFDCQKAVEQFNAFRIKCHKAEERLNKMLSLALPSKLNVTIIKQECSEPDFHDGSLQIKIDSPKLSETLPFNSLKSVKNVKSEVDDSDGECNWNFTKDTQSSELIKIISEEMVNQQRLDDVKQPHIEIISENFNEELKNCDINEDDQFYTCDIKIIPESLNGEGDLNSPGFDIPNAVPDIKEQIIESDDETDAMQLNKLRKSKENQKSRKKSSTDIREQRSSEDEPDEKYLTLQEGEVCDIDLEEMDALIKKKQDPNTLFYCDKCKRNFKFFKCFRKHKEWHKSQPEVFICDFCKNENSPTFEFSTLKSLNNHKQRKHFSSNLNKFTCSLCKRILPSLGQLRAHCKKVHDDSGGTCQTCGKKFKNQACLNSHSKVHQEERPYVCDLCGQSFKWSNALKVHIMWHKQEKNFLCSECGKKFTAKKNLMEHLNIHSGKRPYKCENCNATFTQLSAFSKHLFLHNENSRIHKCDKCNITFSHAYMLKQHLVRHTGLRPFKCSTCGSTFKSQSDLSCHVKIHQGKQYGCQVCGKKFAASKTLRDHMVRHTGVKHICPVPGCGKTYTQRFSLTKHFSKQHPSFSIVKKKSGKRTHLTESAEKQCNDDFIRYDFEEKELKAIHGMELYYFSPSPPCRAVLLFVQALNLDPTLKVIDTTKGEHLSAEYLKLNPQHTIPLIVDGNFVLSESRAILIYLAEQYGQDSSYYPNNPQARGVINQRLMFDIGTLYPRFLDAFVSLLYTDNETLDMSKINRLKEAFEFLESFMGNSYWMAGDEITIADFSLVATVSSIEACGFDLSKYKNITGWLERCENEIIDYEETNQKGADILGNLVKEKLKNEKMGLNKEGKLLHSLLE